jgi:tripartite-type tricarboxylate transporter receptor subunit TctC
MDSLQRKFSWVNVPSIRPIRFVGGYRQVSRVIALSVAAWGTSTPTITAAADQARPVKVFPSKPVRLILGPAPGGPGDITTRIFAAKLAEIWEQQVIVDNRPGAANTLAAAIASKAAPDGYTLLQCSIADTISPALYKTLSYDIRTSFDPVSLIGTTPNVLMINPSIPANSVPEFVTYTKANAGKISYGTAGVGLSTHLSAELFKSRTGADITHVPYKAASIALTDLIGGRIAMMFSNLPAYVDAIKAGKVRALGVSTAKRSTQVPDVPTIAESGVPGFEVTVWTGICTPASTPKPIIAKINADMVKALNMADLRQRLNLQGIDATPTSPEAFAALIKSETAKWAKVVKDSGIPSQ